MSTATDPVVRFTPTIREFLKAPGRFATVATINANGSPHQTVVWFLVEADDSLVINSLIGRRWPTNLRRDPRMSLTVEDGLHYVVLRGSVEEVDDGEEAQAHIAAMARRYETSEHAEDMIANRFRGQHRVSFRLRPRSMTLHWESRS